MKWDWIPNLFYDLLGRIVPGGLVLVLCPLVVVGPSQLVSAVMRDSVQKSATGFGHFGVALLLATIFAYTIGVIIAELSRGILIKPYRKLRLWMHRAEHKKDIEYQKDIESRLKDHLAIDQALGRSQIGLDADQLPGIYSMYGHLRSGAPSEASRLLKLRAEERFCDVVAFGSLILTIVNIVFLYQKSSVERYLLTLMLLLTVYACLRCGQSTRRYFVQSTCSAWLMLVSDSRHRDASLNSSAAGLSAETHEKKEDTKAAERVA